MRASDIILCMSSEFTEIWCVISNNQRQQESKYFDIHSWHDESQIIRLQYICRINSMPERKNCNKYNIGYRAHSMYNVSELTFTTIVADICGRFVNILINKNYSLKIFNFRIVKLNLHMNENRILKLKSVVGTVCLRCLH